jgi:hypothetical protein
MVCKPHGRAPAHTPTHTPHRQVFTTMTTTSYGILKMMRATLAMKRTTRFFATSMMSPSNRMKPNCTCLPPHTHTHTHTHTLSLSHARTVGCPTPQPRTFAQGLELHNRIGGRGWLGWTDAVDLSVSTVTSCLATSSARLNAPIACLVVGCYSCSSPHPSPAPF